MYDALPPDGWPGLDPLDRFWIPRTSVLPVGGVIFSRLPTRSNGTNKVIDRRCIFCYSFPCLPSQTSSLHHSRPYSFPSFNPFISNYFRTLLHHERLQPISFQLLADSFHRHGGVCTPPRISVRTFSQMRTCKSLGCHSYRHIFRQTLYLPLIRKHRGVYQPILVYPERFVRREPSPVRRGRVR
jgi:hypothetical protein